jgi:hypothetical protein
MLIPAPPMSNNERQRRFRASLPGYFRKYKAAGRAARKAPLTMPPLPTLNQEAATRSGCMDLLLPFPS